MVSQLDRISDWVSLARKAKYSVRALAQLVHLSSRQLERYFVEHFQDSPKHWMDEQRMAAAIPLLRKGDPIKQVGDELKFKHPQDFTRSFKRLSGGLPPSTMRRAIRRAERDQ